MMEKWYKAQFDVECGWGAGYAGGLLADAFEALLAALYLDRGMPAARAFLLRLIEVQLQASRISSAWPIITLSQSLCPPQDMATFSPCTSTHVDGGHT